jgi:hypothetical protein
MRFIRALLRAASIDAPRTSHSRLRLLPTGDDSMHEKRKKNLRVSPWTAVQVGQQTDAAGSVGACVKRRSLRAGHRRPASGPHAAHLALGRGSMRARRRESNVGIDIRWNPLDAGRRVEIDAESARIGLLPGKTF